MIVNNNKIKAVLVINARIAGIIIQNVNFWLFVK